jgi:formylglycine-generating enzyme required for sulfatase activity
MGLKRIVWLGCLAAVSSTAALAFVTETQHELIGNGDFNGDGLEDVVIVDRASGKYRIGYGQPGGDVQWINHRVSNVKGATGLAIGHLANLDHDALVISAADDNAVRWVTAENPGVPAKSVEVPFMALGPSSVVALDVGGDGNTPLDDLVVASIYNDPTPNLLNVFRNTDGELESLDDFEDVAPVRWANALTMKQGGPQVFAGIWRGKDGDTFRILDFRSGKPVTHLEQPGLPKGSAFVVGHFSGRPIADVVFYVPGKKTLRACSVERHDDQCRLGAPREFTLEHPVELVVTVGEGRQLVILHDEGETAALYAFDGRNAPRCLHAFEARSGDLFFGAAPVGKAFYLFSAPDYSRFSTHQQGFVWDGSALRERPYGKLADLADSDDATVPDIHKHILEVLKKEGIKTAADMKPYTNTIPGSVVTYSMIPLPGGEFVMGSPEDEKGRRPDEGPRHKVKVSPFWIGEFEVTWNEFELFMYPDDEKKLRQHYPTPDYINVVSDAVTRPSKPYTEMSFGMGRDGFPAICMTQHAANKYCHWLSAKTGHFYRLPTEAEWEYACRAGTTTAYSFGNDVTKLGEYGWFEDNSDFKYHKVGRKKPNPWGLYDMHGNVWEYCLDQYADSYDVVLDQPVDPWNKATTPYPHVVRGGSYDDMATDLRSAARRGSDPSWKMRDPQLPKSIWWFSDAPWVGFRLVRPLKVPGPEKLQQYWTSGVEKE